MNPVPEVYVFWHPKFALAESLAPEIYRWLRPGGGLGPKVFYRSRPLPDATSGSLPTPIPGECRGPRLSHGHQMDPVANVHIVILLVNAIMVADRAWRAWLEGLANSQTLFRRVFIPVALDPTAFNLPAPLRELNFLRPTIPPNSASEAGRQIIAKSLMKQLTETLCRFMIAGSASVEHPDSLSTEPGERSSEQKIKIFLSHAKADGTGPARRIRDYIYQCTQLAAFFDENDISYASAFAKVLERDLAAQQTAALITVRSACYASRPWCRRELATFRKPRRVMMPPDKDAEADYWRMHPVLVVDSMSGSEVTDGIPELGNSVCLRWEDSQTDLEELIVTTLLRDVMLSAFHSAVGAALGKDHSSEHVIINWQPDPTSLLQIDRIRENREELQLVHPGRMSLLELDILMDYFPKVMFRSFEEFRS